MSQIQSTLNNAATGTSTNSASSSLNDLDLDTFLELMIAELQNQDPLNPLENDELLAQISQIREVGATDRLTETLDAVLLGQNVSSATNLIGADVVALTDAGERVSGNVRKVTISDGQPLLDLALDAGTSAASDAGSVAEGSYVYEVVWSDARGTQFSVQLPASTSSFDQFSGSVRLENLPETDGDKRVYRTDATGEGPRRLVGQIPGAASTVVDTAADGDLGEELTGERQRLQFARRETVRLSNIGEITPPE